MNSVNWGSLYSDKIRIFYWKLKRCVEVGMASVEKCLMTVEVKGDLRVPDRHLGACRQEATLSLENIYLLPVRYHPICFEIISIIGNP